MQLRYHKKVSIPVKKMRLEGELNIPANAKCIAIFANDGVYNRKTTMIQVIANYLQQKNVGTLLFDLLNQEEDLHFYNRFDIDLLTTRLISATEWLEMEPASAECRLGFFATDTCAAAALKAAAILPQIGAIVSMDGRPELAVDIMEDLETPVLLIAESADPEIAMSNKEAMLNLIGEKKLEIIDGNGSFVEENGRLEKVCEAAAGWFLKHLRPVVFE